MHWRSSGNVVYLLIIKISDAGLIYYKYQFGIAPDPPLLNFIMFVSSNNFYRYTMIHYRTYTSHTSNIVQTIRALLPST